MRTAAGASSVDAYRQARAQRRRAALRAAVLAAGAAAVGAAAALETAQYRLPLLLAAAAMTLLAWTVRPRPDAERWLRGAAGEQATARLLERLPIRGWAVLHDRRVPGSRANLDHIVIGRTGVWLVDSKTSRAPARAGWRSVRVGGHPLETGPTRWEAQVLADRLGTAVRALIVLHGDGLRRRGVRCRGLRVVPPDGLLRRIRRGRRRLSAAQACDLAIRADSVFPPAALSLEKRRPVGG